MSIMNFLGAMAQVRKKKKQDGLLQVADTIKKKSGSALAWEQAKKGTVSRPKYAEAINRITQQAKQGTSTIERIKNDPQIKAKLAMQSTMNRIREAEKQRKLSEIQKPMTGSKLRNSDISLIETASRQPVTMQKATVEGFNKLSPGFKERVRSQSEKFVNDAPHVAGFLESSVPFMPTGSIRKNQENAYGEMDVDDAYKSKRFMAGSMAGMATQYAMTGGIGAGAIQKGIMAKRGLDSAKLGTQLGSRAGADFLAGLPVNITDSAGRSENAKEFAKNLAINSLLDVGVGGAMALPGAKKAVRAIAPKGANPEKWAKLSEKEKKAVLKVLGKKNYSVENPKVDTNIDNAIKPSTNSTQDPVGDVNDIPQPNKTSESPPRSDNSPSRGSEETEVSTNIPPSDPSVNASNIPKNNVKFVKNKDRGFDVDAIKDSFKRNFVDTLTAVEKLAKQIGGKQGEELMGQANAARQAGNRASYQLFDKQTDYNLKPLGKSAEEIIKPIKKNKVEWNDFQSYVQHKNNVARADLGKGIFGDGTTSEQSLQVIADMEKRYPHFVEAQKDVRDYFQNLLLVREQAGLISPETRKNLIEMYPDYVPGMRAVDKHGKQVSFDSVGADTGIKTAKGSDLDILELDDQMATATSEVWQAVEANRLIQMISKATNPADIPLSPNLLGDTNAPLETATFLSKDGDNYMAHYFENGKFVKTNINKDIYLGLEDLMNAGLDGNEWGKLATKALGPINTTFKRLITSLSPFFLARNASRDMQDALFYSQSTRKFISSMPKAMTEMANHKTSPYWKLWKSSGGLNSSFYDFEKGFTDSVLKKMSPMQKIELINQGIEQYPRFIEFVAVLDKELAGQPIENATRAMINKASHAGADITVNFGRSGKVGKMVNKSLVPFFNPAMQGADKFVRHVKTHKGRAIFSLALKATALGIAPSVINEIVYAGDQDYQELNQRDRDTNFLIKDENGEFYKIPKGRVLSAMGMVGTGIYRELTGKEVDWGDKIETAKDQVAPQNPFESNIMAPLIKTKLHDEEDPGETWYGTPIESMGDSSLPAGERYDERTTKVAKILGEKFNLSPKKIDYLIGSYSGVAGDVVQPLMTDMAERSILKQNFKIDPVTQNSLSTKFYDRNTELYRKSNSQESTTEDRLTSKWYGKKQYEVAELNKKIKSINTSNISDDEKREQSREVKKQINEILRSTMANESVFTQQVAVNKGNYDKDDDVYETATIRTAQKLGGDGWDETKAFMKSSENRVNLADDAKAVGIDPVEYNDFFKENKDLDGSSKEGTPTKKELFAFLEGTDFTTEQKAVLWAGHRKDWADNNPFAGGSISSSRGGKKGGRKRSGRKGRGGSRVAKPKMTESEKLFASLANQKVDYDFKMPKLSSAESKALISLMKKKFNAT